MTAPRIINLTPHPVVFQTEDDRTLTFPCSGKIARVDTKQITSFDIDMEFDNIVMPVVSTVFGKVQFLPPPEPDTFFIVSSIAKDHAGRRDDLLVPEGFIRDANGLVTACTRFRI